MWSTFTSRVVQTRRSENEMLPSQKEKICRQREKMIYFSCQRTRCFSSKCKHCKKKKDPNFLKSNLSVHLFFCLLFICLSINAPESLGKITDIQKDCFYQYIHSTRLFFLYKLLLVELFDCFFLPAPPVLITNALFVLPVGQIPHLVCDHQLLNVSKELYSTDLCQWSCIWEIIVHWIYLL